MMVENEPTKSKKSTKTKKRNMILNWEFFVQPRFILWYLKLQKTKGWSHQWNGNRQFAQIFRWRRLLRNPIFVQPNILHSLTPKAHHVQFYVDERNYQHRLPILSCHKKTICSRLQFQVFNSIPEEEVDDMEWNSTPFLAVGSAGGTGKENQ